MAPINPKSGPLCPSCGYCLHSLESNRCPECGNTFTKDDLVYEIDWDDPRNRADRRVILAQRWATICGFVLMIVGIALFMLHYSQIGLPPVQAFLFGGGSRGSRRMTGGVLLVLSAAIIYWRYKIDEPIHWVTLGLGGFWLIVGFAIWYGGKSASRM